MPYAENAKRIISSIRSAAVLWDKNNKKQVPEKRAEEAFCLQITAGCASVYSVPNFLIA
jgi:hypothetical protein